MAYLVDTCVLIDHLTGRLPAKAQEKLERLLVTAGVCTSAVVYHELLTGATTAKARKTVEQLLEAWDIIPVDAVIAAEGAQIRRRWRERGRTIGMADSLIAATAKVRNLVVVTGNVKDFPDVATLDPRI
jgi:hypothetical protein